MRRTIPAVFLLAVTAVSCGTSSTSPLPEHIASDDAFVYYVAPTEGAIAIFRTALDGSGTDRIADVTEDQVDGLAVNSGELAWAAGCQLSSAHGTDGIRTYATPGRCAGGPIAVNASAIYWFDQTTTDLMRTSVAGDGSDSVVFEYGALDLSAPANTPIVVAPKDLTVSGDYVYWTDWGLETSGSTPTGSVEAASIASGNVTVIAAQIARPTGISATEAAVFWAVFGDTQTPGGIYRAAVSDWSPQLLVPNQVGAGTIVLTNNSIGWIAGAAHASCSSNSGCSSAVLRRSSPIGSIPSDVLGVNSDAIFDDYVIAGSSSALHWLTSDSVISLGDDGKQSSVPR